MIILRGDYYLDKLNHSYGFLLGKALQQMEDKFANALSPINIDARQYGILLFIKDNPNSSQKTISERLQIDRTSMVSHVDHLESLNFVKRTKNPYDRRAYSLVITKKGSDVLESCWNLLQSIELEVLSPITKQEKETLKKTLLKIWKSI